MLTFVLVGLGFDAENGDDHDDDDNGSCSQCHNKPGFSVEGLSLQVTILQVNL